jgi:hypothetical protein
MNRPNIDVGTDYGVLTCFFFRLPNVEEAINYFIFIFMSTTVDFHQQC